MVTKLVCVEQDAFLHYRTGAFVTRLGSLPSGEVSSAVHQEAGTVDLEGNHFSPCSPTKYFKAMFASVPCTAAAVCNAQSDLVFNACGCGV